MGARGIGGASLVALVVLAGCNRVPAEEALAEAEETLAVARPALPREEVPAFERALDQARAALAEGRYTDSLRITQELPSHIHAAIARAADRRRAEPHQATPAPEPGPSPIQPPLAPTPAAGGGVDARAPGS
jgi:hypothetical protein